MELNFQDYPDGVAIWRRDRWLQHMQHNWQPGQHVALWGKTGCGKTTVCARLVALRKFAVVLASKQQDNTLEQYQDFQIVKSWKDRQWYQNHVIVWPQAKTLEEVEEAFRKESAYTMDAIYYERGWTFQIDDMKMIRHLGLSEKVRSLLAHCRSQGSSIVINDVRPFRTVAEALDQTSYNLMFYMKDRRDVWRMAESNGEDPLLLESLNSQLRPFEFLFLPAQGEPVIVRNS